MEYIHRCKFREMTMTLTRYRFQGQSHKDPLGWNGNCHVRYKQEGNGAGTSCMFTQKEEIVRYLNNHKHPQCKKNFTERDIFNLLEE